MNNRSREHNAAIDDLTDITAALDEAMGIFSRLAAPRAERDGCMGRIGANARAIALHSPDSIARHRAYAILDNTEGAVASNAVIDRRTDLAAGKVQDARNTVPKLTGFIASSLGVTTSGLRLVK